MVSRHKDWGYRFIYRYIGNSADAYDIRQDTFFAAWHALSRYQRERPFEFWLRRIALNKCRDRTGRETVRRLVAGRANGEEMAEISNPAPGPPELLGEQRELRVLELNMHKLPRSLKEPLLLTALEGLSHEQAGQILGVSAKAIETKTYRARRRLGELYGRPR
jgi:RNA polymerase sigma factor CnrH